MVGNLGGSGFQDSKVSARNSDFHNHAIPETQIFGHAAMQDCKHTESLGVIFLCADSAAFSEVLVWSTGVLRFPDCLNLGYILNVGLCAIAGGKCLSTPDASIITRKIGVDS